MRLSQLALISLIAASAALSGCAVYAPAPYGPAVVVRPVPVIVSPGWGYGYGYHHWRRW
ncbi:hypothetical protein ACO0K3_17590 [Undibacterium sp. Rencai35W]|uniref:hypothetical protein n=1 Tax=unclassified Undibacterium TaxID=2630295 RepID=UPI003BF278A4